MIGILVKKQRDREAAQAASESAKQKAQYKQRVAEVKAQADKMNEVFPLGVELENLTRAEGKLIGYSASIKANTITPLIKERIELQTDADLNGVNHSKRIAEIDAILKESRSTLKKLGTQLEEVQGQIETLSEKIAKMPRSADIGV